MKFIKNGLKEINDIQNYKDIKEVNMLELLH